MNVKQKLLSVLDSFGYPVFLQGTLAADEPYPSSFVTYWTNYTDDNAHFNNGVHSVDWNFSVIFYANSATIVNTKPAEIIAALRAAGFIPQGVGQDIPSDELTHTGWAMEFIYTKENSFNERR